MQPRIGFIQSMFSRKILRRTLGVLAIVAGVLAIYWPALGGTWLWDDGYEIANNPVLRDPHGLVKIWSGSNALDYFPLKATIQWLFWRVWADHPAGWHLLSVGLHMANALLVWRLLSRIGLRSAWLAGVIFAVHPLAVESVAWIAELKNTLSLAPALLAFCFYLDYDQRRQPRDLGWALLFFLAAMLCKSTVVMLPCVLAVYLWWRHGAAAWRRLPSLMGFFGLALALGLVTVWFQHHRAIGGAEIPVGGWDTRIARAGLALTFYLGKAVWPFELMPVYPRWAVDPPAAWQFLPWLGFAAGGIWLWRQRRSWGRPVLFGLSAYALNLAPILGFLAMAYMHVSWVADHFAYAALPAAAGLLALGFQTLDTLLPASLQRFGRISMGILLVLTGMLGHAYARQFRSAAALWLHAVELNPDSAVAQNNLGGVYLKAGNPGAAAQHFALAVRLEPKFVGARINLGHGLAALGQIDAALAAHRQAVADAPLNPTALNGLSGTLLDAGLLDEARQMAGRALAVDPASAEAYNNLGVACARAGDETEAREFFETALKYEPSLTAARANLALLNSSREQAKK